MLPPETMQTTLPLAPGMLERAGHRGGSGAFGDDPVAFGYQTQGRRQLRLGVATSTPSSNRWASSNICGNTDLPPIPSTKERCGSMNCGDPAFQETLQRRGGRHFGGEDLGGRLQLADGRRDSARQASAAPGNDDRVDVRQVFQNLEADGSVSGHDIQIVEGMDEGALDAG